MIRRTFFKSVIAGIAALPAIVKGALVKPAVNIRRVNIVSLVIRPDFSKGSTMHKDRPWSEIKRGDCFQVISTPDDQDHDKWFYAKSDAYPNPDMELRATVVVIPLSEVRPMQDTICVTTRHDTHEEDVAEIKSHLMKWRPAMLACLVWLLSLISMSAQSLVLTNNAPKILVGAESKATYIDLRTNTTRAIYVYRTVEDVPVILDFRRILNDLKPVGSLVHIWQHDTVSGETAIAEPLRDYFIFLSGMMGRAFQPPFTPAEINASLVPWTNVWTSPYTGQVTTNRLFNISYVNLVKLWRCHVTYYTIAGDDLLLIPYPVSMYEEGRSNHVWLVQKFGTWFVPPITTNTGSVGPYANVATEPVWTLDRTTYIKNKLMKSWNQVFP